MLYGTVNGVNIFVLFNRYRHSDEPSTWVSAMSDWSDVFTLVVFVLGNVWLTGCKTCAKTAPGLFYASLAWIVWGYLLILLPLIGIACIILCLPCFIVLFQVFNIRSPLTARHGATDEQIDRLKLVKVAEASIAEDDTSCAICLSEYEADEHLRLLACQHHFHQPCVDQWLRISATCPLCVQSVLAEEQV